MYSLSFRVHSLGFLQPFLLLHVTIPLSFPIYIAHHYDLECSYTFSRYVLPVSRSEGTSAACEHLIRCRKGRSQENNSIALSTEAAYLEPGIHESMVSADSWIVVPCHQETAVAN